MIPFFSESWVYSSCLSVVSYTEELIAVTTPSHSRESVSLYEGAKAELLHYARMQLDTLGFVADLIPFSINTSPTIMKSRGVLPAGATQSVMDKSATLHVTNVGLKACLGSMEAFDDVYTKLTNRALKSFEYGNRIRTTWALKADLAYLAFHRKQYSEAAEILEQISPNYVMDKWSVLDAAILHTLIICYRELSRRTDFVRVVAGALATVCDEEKATLLATELNTTTREMESEWTIDGWSGLRISVIGLVNKVGDDEDLIVDAIVHSSLFPSFKLDRVSICLQSGLGGEETQIWFSLEDLTVEHGDNLVRLKSEKTAFPGNYTVEKAAIQVGKMALTYTLHSRVPRDPIFEPPVNSTKERYFRIIELSTSVQVTVSQSDMVVYGDPIERIVTKIYARQHGIQEGTMNLSCSNDPTLFSNEMTVVVNICGTETPTKTFEISVVDGKFSIPSCQEGQVIHLIIPCKSVNTSTLYRIKLVMYYTSLDGKKRLYSNIEKIRLTRSIGISHDIVHTEACAFARFELTGIEEDPLRIVDMSLDSSSEWESCRLAPVQETTLFNDQKYTLVYRLTEDVESTPKPESRMILSVKYYSISKELELYITSLLSQKLAESNLTMYTGLLTYFLRKRVFPKLLDYIAYGMHSRISFAKWDNTWLETLLSTEDEQVRAQIFQFTDNFYEAVKNLDEKDIKSVSRVEAQKVVYYLDPPKRKVFFTADLHMPEKLRHTIGEQLRCTLTLQIPELIPELQKDVRIICRVESDPRHWIACGKTRFAVDTEKSKMELKLVLIPLKAGLLPYPKILLETLRGDGNLLECNYLKTANQILIVPRTLGRNFKIHEQQTMVSVV